MDELDPQKQAEAKQKQVCQNIADLLEKSPKSLRTIAKETGLAHTTLSRIANGKEDPSIKTLYLIAYGLEVPLSRIIGR